jgi:hypothetical protein
MDLFAFHDHRTVAQHSSTLVLAQRHEIMFRDGSTVHLHPVAHGEPHLVDPLLRAVNAEGLRWLVLDLARMNAEIAADLKRLEARDSFGVVFYSLRGMFPTARDFLAAVQQLHTVAWWPAPPQVAA